MEHQSKKITKLLPVNHLLQAGSKINLCVRIPDTFKPVGDVYQPFTEFIPTTDATADRWSQIITTCTMVGKKISAQDMITTHKQHFNTQATQVRVLYDSVENMSTHVIATLLLKYIYKSRTEIMFARYLSGPCDASGFQYTIDATHKIESEVLTELKDFAEEQTTIIKS